MSSLSNSTSDLHLSQPELWQFYLALMPRSIDFILYAPSQDDSLVVRSLALDNSGGDYLKAVENVVYDNPVLLNDFHSVRVLIDAPHFVIVPPTVSDNDDLDALLRIAYPDAQGEAMLCRLPHCGMGIVSEVPQGVLPFVQRTFNNPPVVHHLYPLCEHFERLNAHSSIARMFVNLSPHRMDLVVYRQGRLELANTFNYRSMDDAAYFILHAYDSLKMNRLSDEIQLSGDRDVREQLTPLLRRFINYVMPAIYPAAALRLGHDAMKAPFDLIMLALCE
ncbi:MAG: DUF3822 family protein [Muribaculaceae bacterium]|jgi:hypothetical protein|nr:DUF3822 family protein [Muribaculaceae bacterium]MBQ1798741.1 DUF3822 family protein [Muribaculaceae bacterium]MBQ2236151.1 DUF3822 family protein [Muribaculaceae bacterium]MBQ4005667.1 DUF3822 family protein [Muribaculaceae bacterium]